ncbi:MATE family efflux transporter [Pseudomonas sp. SDO528_S397]
MDVIKQRPLWQVYLIFLAPMVLSNFLQTFSGTLNGIYVGQLLGTQALAAVSGMFPIVFFFVALVIGLGAGASVLIGQAWGARELGMVKVITGSTLTLGALVGVAAAVLGSLFARQALIGLGTPLDVLDAAVGYASGLMMIMPLLLVFILYTQLLRGVSDTVSPLLALMVSTLVGLLLTPALIRGWLGLAPMGIESGVYAGLVSNAVAMLFLVLRLRHKKHVMAPDRELLAALRLNPAILGKILRIGLPTGLQMVVLSLSELVILALVNSHGSQATAAYGAVTQLANYVQFPAMSIAITASILGAQAIGAGRVERIGSILRTGLLINLWLTGGLIVLGYGLSHWLLGLFIIDPEALIKAERLLYILLWSVLVYGFQAVVGGIMRASGVVLMPVVIAILCMVFVQMPSAYLLNARFGLEGVWMSFPVTYLAMLVSQVVYYRQVWRHKQIKRLV